MGSGTGPGEQLSGRGRLYRNQECLSGTAIWKNFLHLSAAFEVGGKC